MPFAGGFMPTETRLDMSFAAFTIGETMLLFRTAGPGGDDDVALPGRLLTSMVPSVLFFGFTAYLERLVPISPVHLVLTVQ